MEIYILGLESEFRGTRLVNYFQSISILPKVVFGIDGRVNSGELKKYSASKSRMKLIMDRHLTSAEVAVALGHRLIYKKFLESGSEWAIILEDDSFPTENFNLDKIPLMNVTSPLIVDLSGIESLVQNYESFPCLILGAQNLSSSERDFIVYQTLGNTFGCWAYLINRKAAEIAIDNFDLVDSAVDWPHSWRDKIHFARPEKCQFSVDLEGSLVDEGRAQELAAGGTFVKILGKSKHLMRFRTLFGLLGVLSLIARFRGLGFRQHYKEKVLIPFLLRRIDTIG